MTRNKGIVTAIIAFTTIFMVSVVFALASGSLTMSGDYTFMPQANVELIIVNADFSSSTPIRIDQEYEESVEVPGVLEGGDLHTMYIVVDLLFPGDKRIVEFSIQNIEAVSAKLDDLVVYDPEIETSGIKITWPNLKDVVILSGQTSGPYQIEIEWDINNYDPSNTGYHIFEASIVYYQVI